MAISVPWLPAAIGTGTKVAPRPSQQGVDPIIGVPTSQIPTGPIPITPESDLERASKEGMTLSEPGAIAVEKLGNGNNQRQRNCRCPASHLCQGKPSILPRGLNGLEYQLYIANLKSKPLVFSNLGLNPSGKSYKVTEWAFSTVNDFDGFWNSQCKLVEAKSKVGFLFTISPKKKQETLDKFHNQMFKHIMALQPYWKSQNNNQQKVEIEWHFLEKNVYQEVTQNISIKNLIVQGLKIKNTPYMFNSEREKLDRKREKEHEINRKNGWEV